MHPILHQAAEFLGHAMHHYDQCRAQIAPSSPFSGVPNQLAQILKELRIMSETMTKLTDAVAGLKTKLDAAEGRDAARTQADAGLKAQIAAQTEQLTALQAQLAAMPQDTAAQEAMLAAVVASLQQVSSGLDTIAAEPAAAPEPAPAPAEPTAPAAPVATPAEPVPEVPVPADPSTPAA